MILYPSIEIKDGQCVRAIQGNLDDVVVANPDPVAQAKDFKEMGFKCLHVVDLDGVLKKQPVNVTVLEDIIKTVGLPVQLGGGFRTMENIETWIGKGAHRIVLGTMALEDPNLVKIACARFPDQIAIALDTKNGYVVTSAWSSTSTVRLLDLALKMEEMGAATLIYTDVDRDGAQLGLNVDEAVDLAWSVTTPVIANGGMSSIEELSTLNDDKNGGLAGVICGSSLYDGRIDPHAALRLLEGENQ